MQGDLIVDIVDGSEHGDVCAIGDDLDLGHRADGFDVLGGGAAVEASAAVIIDPNGRQNHWSPNFQ